MAAQQLRHWCFRYSNPTETSDELIELFKKEPQLRYVVFQKEKGEEGGHIHYQGYVEFKRPKRLGGLKKIHKSIHWEQRRGTREQARDYCMKEDTREDGPWEFGDFGLTPGARTDLADLYKLAREEKTLLAVAEAMPGPYMRAYKAVQHVRQLEAFDKPNRTTDLEVVLLFGPPGSGKTRMVYHDSPDVYAIPIGKQLWFDGYRGEKHVLIDDFSGNMRLVDTLRLLDRYPIQVPIKGGHVWWCPDKIYLTCNVHPLDWYDYTKRKDSYQALTRRIHRVIQFHEDGDFFELEPDEKQEFFISRNQ